jgi:spermidine synthase
LSWLINKPAGTLFFEPSGDHFVVVDKINSQIRLWLANPTSDLVQSRLELNDPLYPVSPYSQAAMLGLVWNKEPERCYVIGLGGGRIPLVWHHYLPDVVVDCTEIDSMVTRAAIRFFGLQPDARLRIVHQDGRDYLAQQAENIRYDLILVDAFGGSGDGPYHLATKQFYWLCQRHLTSEGVMIVNVLNHDSLHAEKIKTIQSMFEHVYLWPMGRGNGVVFGTNSVGLTRTELEERAQLVQDHFQFPFSLVKMAQDLKIGGAINDCVPQLEHAAVLIDKE